MWRKATKSMQPYGCQNTWKAVCAVRVTLEDTMHFELAAQFVRKKNSVQLGFVNTLGFF